MEELAAIRERARQAMSVREGNQQATMIAVAMGTCGIAKGARDVMMAIVDEAAKRGLGSVLVTQSGCAGYCEEEPLIRVKVPGQSDVVYGRLDEASAREVVVKHLVHGETMDSHRVHLPGGEPLA